MAEFQIPAFAAASRQLTAAEFVESAGAIVFNESLDRVCLLYYHERNEWLLAKGRRNCGESRRDAAIREVKEETGYSCRLLPVTMSTRAPPAIEEDTSLPDEARRQTNVTEPCSLIMREVNGGLKLTWWFIAVADEAESPPPAEAQFTPCFFSRAEALEKLTFPADQKTLETAINIVDAHYSG